MRFYTFGDVQGKPTCDNCGKPVPKIRKSIFCNKCQKEIQKNNEKIVGWDISNSLKYNRIEKIAKQK